MIEVEKYGDFKTLCVENNKKQIILTHTSRNIENYLMSLKYRFNGKFKRIPHYIVSRNGKVLNLLSNESVSEYIPNSSTNKNSIIICLENLGWIHKEPLKETYINWIGDIYKGEVFERKWRDYFFWQPYTEIQIEKVAKLCRKLLDDMLIQDEIIGHNTRINGIEKFEGILTRSNFDSESTDVSPAFDFELFKKKFENE